MNVTDTLRRMGFDASQIAAATINGKPIAQAEPPKPKSPYRSKMEQHFAWKLEADKAAGLIDWWAYEPVTLVIVDASGKRCRYTPDFATVTLGGLCKDVPILEFYEVKGHCREAARLRFLAARERYPFWHFTMVHREKDGTWTELLA
jgi:hypothetical protein